MRSAPGRRLAGQRRRPPASQPPTAAHQRHERQRAVRHGQAIKGPLLPRRAGVDCPPPASTGEPSREVHLRRDGTNSQLLQALLAAPSHARTMTAGLLGARSKTRARTL
jgi:hypothetical protein